LKIIVGLGNPGPKYERTRHNMGFLALDEFVNRCRLKTGAVVKEADAWTTAVSVRGRRALLAKPTTFMNLSGQSVKGLLGLHRAGPVDLIVVHDDLDLPLGTVRVKKNGGDGGHNGVASVIAELGTEEFARLRLGIGRPPDRMDPAEYVLSPFLGEELETAAAELETAAEALLVMVREGVGRAMNTFNRRKPPKPGCETAGESEGG